jgi:tetratricopeptide (TPR) repeat protein
LDLANAGRLDEADHYYRLALTHDPNLSAAFNNWGNLAFNQRRYALALQRYEAGLRRNPDDAGLIANRNLARSKLTR